MYNSNYAILIEDVLFVDLSLQPPSSWVSLSPLQPSFEPVRRPPALQAQGGELSPQHGHLWLGREDLARRYAWSVPILVPKLPRALSNGTFFNPGWTECC